MNRNATQATAVIRSALFNEWDPIGVRDIPGAVGEYDAYVGEIYSLLAKRATAEEIFNYLWHLETGHMGLEGDRKNTESFTRRLLLLAQEIDCQ